MAVSCTSDELVDNVKESKVSFEIPAFEIENGVETRTTFDFSSKYVTWTNWEQIGIRPNSHYGIMLPFSIGRFSDNTTLFSLNSSYLYDFTNEEWELKDNVEYSAFYPYSFVGESTDIKLDLSNKNTIVDGSTSSVNIGSYDYMFAPPSRNYKGSLSFSMKRLYGLLCIKFTSMQRKTWKKISLSTANGENTLATSASVFFGYGIVGSSKGISSLTFYSGSGKSLSTSFSIHFPLFECSTGDLVLTLEDVDGNVYNESLNSKNVKNGGYYQWVVKGSELNIGNACECVDLGLPSGRKWATMNVGAKTATDFGTYFAWGEVTGFERNADGSIKPAIMDGYSSTWTGPKNSNYIKGALNPSMRVNGLCIGYKWGREYEDNRFEYYKYCSYVNRTSDNKKVLDPEDDAATVNWGPEWRMPTMEDYKELAENCYSVWTSNYNSTGVPGCIVFKARSASDKGVQLFYDKSPKTGYRISTTAHIFMPAAGGVDGDFFGAVRYNGYYWSSSLVDNDRAYEFGFADRFFFYDGRNSRFNAALPVRAVRK